jgi:hypothetical protein
MLDLSKRDLQEARAETCKKQEQRLARSKSRDLQEARAETCKKQAKVSAALRRNGEIKVINFSISVRWLQ